MDTVDTVKEFYNNNVEHEWNRIPGRPEYLLTSRYIDRYVKPGEKVLDIGGGPGRYSRLRKNPKKRRNKARKPVRKMI